MATEIVIAKYGRGTELGAGFGAIAGGLLAYNLKSKFKGYIVCLIVFSVLGGMAGHVYEQIKD